MENLEKQTNVEKKEEMDSRHIDIHMVRHGQQNEYEDTKSQLSPEGEKQAKQFALELLKSYSGQEVIIKIKHSPVDRAAQTANVIEATISEKLTANKKSDEYAKISLYNTKLTSDLKTTGGLGPIIKSGVPYDKSLDEWLTNADKYSEARKPSEIADQIEKMVDNSNKLIHNISDEGPNIVYVWVTHETAHAAVAQRLMKNSSSEDIGEKIEHLEDMKISISNNPNSKPSVKFKEKTFNLNK